LIQKVTKKIKSVEMLLCRTWPLPRKSGKTWAAIFLPSALPLMPTASVKICYALPHTRPPLFCLLSSEAVLLTGKRALSRTKGRMINHSSFDFTFSFSVLTAIHQNGKKLRVICFDKSSLPQLL